MAEEELKLLNYIPEVISKKRKSNEEWAIRRKQQLERTRKIKGDNFITKKLEQFIREYHDTGSVKLESPNHPLIHVAEAGKAVGTIFCASFELESKGKATYNGAPTIHHIFEGQTTVRQAAFCHQLPPVDHCWCLHSIFFSTSSTPQLALASRGAQGEYPLVPKRRTRLGDAQRVAKGPSEQRPGQSFPDHEEDNWHATIRCMHAGMVELRQVLVVNILKMPDPKAGEGLSEVRLVGRGVPPRDKSRGKQTLYSYDEVESQSQGRTYQGPRVGDRPP
ncbi:hypothetical protein Acr_28g0000490 [Actinidia rufa]|uniref:Uncharacterized protein n=1 Tax=Actinidia rufa TaxID=165716 RepID=A0A7J0H994_9ERIC|nr:hypothetical protein Acr_28g0000490 [Actinidia rufa]